MPKIMGHSLVSMHFQQCTRSIRPKPVSLHVPIQNRIAFYCTPRIFTNIFISMQPENLHTLIYKMQIIFDANSLRIFSEHMTHGEQMRKPHVSSVVTLYLVFTYYAVGNCLGYQKRNYRQQFVHDLTIFTIR